MKELKKLALILRSLGITAKVVDDEQITDGNGEIIDDNVYLECDHENVHFDVWLYDDGDYELHYTLGGKLMNDNIYASTSMRVINEITARCLHHSYK